jgi:predicted secreted protein
MNPNLILLALIISTIIMTVYYFSVFSQDKIKNYSNLVFSLFIVHLVIVYFIVFIVLYLFVKTIINSKNIYPRRSKYPANPNYSRPENSRFNDLFFNQNFNRLFRRQNRIQPNINRMKPEYIVGDASVGIPYTEWE